MIDRAVISIDTKRKGIMPTLEEQETIITQNRADDFVSVWTSNTHDLAYFRKTKGFELVSEDTYEGEIVSAEFRVPRERANIRKILRRTMSQGQKAQAANRLAQYRQNLSETSNSAPVE